MGHDVRRELVDEQRDPAGRAATPNGVLNRDADHLVLYHRQRIVKA